MSEKFDGLYNIRPATDDDRNFILKSFLLGLYYGETWFSKIPKRTFMDNYKRVVEALFYKHKNSSRVACLPEDPTVILGYAVLNADATVLHFLYVKEVWRNKGIGRQLVPNTVNCVTHLTQLGDLLIKNKDITFNPFNLT